jgi:hypothetical protein
VQDWLQMLAAAGAGAGIAVALVGYLGRTWLGQYLQLAVIREQSRLGEEVQTRLERIRSELQRLSGLQTTVQHNRAQAAAALQIAAVALIDHIIQTSRLVPSPGDDEHKEPGYQVTLDTSWQEAKEQLFRFEDRLFEAWAHADVFLPDESAEFIDQVQMLRIDLRSAVATWRAIVRDPGHPRDQFLQQDFAAELRQRALDLRQKVRAYLRSIAQMSEPATPPLAGKGR